MKTILKIEHLLCFSEKNKLYFFTEFSDGINIIHGKNTSGKSTVFQSIIYSFGINDGSAYLAEILANDVLFRIELTLSNDEESTRIILIREGDTLVAKIGDLPPKRFSGINGNSSFEHIKLKEFLSELFNFKLQLESKGEYKIAPIETLWLPYYISQTVGWVYLRKSFSSLDYYRNFKEDYLDYYLGIEQFSDRVEKHKLQAELKEKESQIAIVASIEKQDDTLQITKLVDEEFASYSRSYFESYAEQQKQLADNEGEYILRCNELALLKERGSVLRKVSSNHKKQNPSDSNCPVCEQKLPSGLAAAYKYLQDENDTKQQVVLNKQEIKDVQTKINSLKNLIEKRRDQVADQYATLRKFERANITYDNWMGHKANVKLIHDLSSKIGELTKEKAAIEDKLSNFKTDQEIVKERNSKAALFSQIFSQNLIGLQVKKLVEDRYTQLYQISSFPSQGVELHKTVMAYHFAFNKLAASNVDIHRFPFLLDGIFKEDIDEANKKLILKFVGINAPKDTQILMSLAEDKNVSALVDAYNKEFFSDSAKLICIGGGVSERSFLQLYADEQEVLIQETIELLYSEQ